jgi:hypothetical protein
MKGRTPLPLLAIALVALILTGCTAPTNITPPNESPSMHPSTPATTPVPADQAAALAMTRLEKTGWRIPDSAAGLAVNEIPSGNYTDFTDIITITFTAQRDELLAMIPEGGGAPFLRPSDRLNSVQTTFANVSRIEQPFHFASANSQTVPYWVNVLLLPDDGDHPQVTILSYYQSR